MTKTYDIELNPIENGVQQVYNDIRESLELILMGSDAVAHPNEVMDIINSLDDALSNNWYRLMLSFWRGVKQDIEEMETQ